VRFKPTSIDGAYLIEPELAEDQRGFFARLWCAEEFRENGLDTRLAQASISYNRRRGTIRGLHWQAAPYGENKLVRCSAGAIYDVLVDIRPHSTSYMRWEAFLLSHRNRRMIFIPEGIAHGFQTLEDDTEISYQMSEAYHPEAACGLRWDDPSFNIIWPISDPILSLKDCSYECFTDAHLAACA
jgi:dTDP-4-dehydrorhamnose 3,5-epimerase